MSCVNRSDGMVNNVNPDYIAPLCVVWSGFTLLAQAYLSEYLSRANTVPYALTLLHHKWAKLPSWSSAIY